MITPSAFPSLQILCIQSIASSFRESWQPSSPTSFAEISLSPLEYQIFPPCFLCSSPISAQMFSAAFFLQPVEEHTSVCQFHKASFLPVIFFHNYFFTLTRYLFNPVAETSLKNTVLWCLNVQNMSFCAAGYSGELLGQELSKPSIGERRQTFLPLQESLGFPVKQLEKSGTQHLNRR